MCYLGAVAFRGLTDAVQFVSITSCFTSWSFNFIHSTQGVTHYFIIKNTHTLQYVFMKNVTYTEFRAIYGFRQLLVYALHPEVIKSHSDIPVLSPEWLM